MQPREYALTDSVRTADQLVYTGAGYFYGIIMVGDGTNTWTIDIYDNTSGTGTKLVPTLQFAATPRLQTLLLPFPIPFATGLYVDMTCTGTLNYMTLFRKRLAV